MSSADRVDFQEPFWIGKRFQSAYIHTHILLCCVRVPPATGLKTKLATNQRRPRPTTPATLTNTQSRRQRRPPAAPKQQRTPRTSSPSMYLVKSFLMILSRMMPKKTVRMSTSTNELMMDSQWICAGRKGRRGRKHTHTHTHTHTHRRGGGYTRM